PSPRPRRAPSSRRSTTSCSRTSSPAASSSQTAFGGNPVASAAACAVVEAIDDELLANVVARGAQLADGLRQLPRVRQVRGRGLMIGARLDGDAASAVDGCRERGLLALSAGPDVLRFLPPLVVDAGEVDEALAVLGDLLA
ncbi:MAG: aminotransferase class III-fold pyridoxal phosphate-dependent enzyme, partial [Actinobacteria bacterium]|nr:aminotransferase class III-fold pyridoxal phosphate-dependent enzyme [Actinomycetota bacterium]